MQINNSNIYNDYVDISYLIEEYKRNYLNKYKVLTQLQSFWNDNKSQLFFEYIEKQKTQMYTTFEELDKVKELYRMLLDNYSEIGNKVSLFEKNSSELFSQFDNYISLGETVLSKYKSMNLNAQDSEIVFIEQQIEKLESNILIVKNVKSKVLDLVNKILDDERSMKEKIASIDIKQIKESDINEFL